MNWVLKSEQELQSQQKTRKRIQRVNNVKRLGNTVSARGCQQAPKGLVVTNKLGKEVGSDPKRPGLAC